MGQRGLGDLIEVRSPFDEGACGLSVSHLERIAAVLHTDGDELHSNLCQQIDPEVLLVAMKGPVLSTTGIGHLLVGHGWVSSRISILDREGGTVVSPMVPPGQPEFTGTLAFDVCPGNEMLVQATQSRVVVWDMSSFEPVTVHDVTEPDGYPSVVAVDCRDEKASSIWIGATDQGGSGLAEIVGGVFWIIRLEGSTFHIGDDYVITQRDGQDDPIKVDIATGERLQLHETPAGENWSINVAPAPDGGRIAIVETRFPREGPVEATLLILDKDGNELDRFEIPWEAYSPVWLDDNLVLVQAYDFEDWESSTAHVFDLDSRGSVTVPGWRAGYVEGNADLVYGIDQSTVVEGNLATGEIRDLATMPTQFAGPLVILPMAPEVAPTTTVEGPVTEPTVPPLVVAPPEDGNGVDPRDIAVVSFGLVMLAALAGTVVSVIRSRGGESD